MSQDPDRADRFVTRTLGELATAPAEIRAAVLAFITEQCNASRAAAQLYTHRNTVLRRIPPRGAVVASSTGREQRARRRGGGHGLAHWSGNSDTWKTWRR